jgi:Holliday junction resolvase RusA-like endonuclease
MNHGRFFKNDAYRLFEQLAALALLRQNIRPYPPCVKLGCAITVVPDNNRRRDLDSYTKCAWDLLQAKGIITDDFQFWHLEIDRTPKQKVAKLIIKLWIIDED